METIYDTTGRDKWLVAFEQTVRSIDSILWHCQEEWVILLPLAFVIAYLSYTLQYTPTFPYFKHLPLYRNTALFADRQQGVVLPLHKQRAKSLSAQRPLFAPGFTVSLASPHYGSSDRDSSLYIPPRPSPLRSYFTESDSAGQVVTCGLRKTVYLSPLAHQFSGDAHASVSSAIAPQLQRQSPTSNTAYSASEDVFREFATPLGIVPLPSRNSCRPKKAKSFDNFRSTLFPLWEAEESEDLSTTIRPEVTFERQAGRRLLGKKRACSNA
ncbi:hypothetical protein QFC20_001830 [Naganishia adeliensis]|uniref:Uncharacterized protein n=1 Tax=Naganishia adeliensis TaxID=92952 RepID=A0ACC2WQN5_9TREE|nr:hypothetical protein QFC20_001830 [Naganishia adeliensis]